jgi:Ca2+-binding EF-hand superfamily protein
MASQMDEWFDAYDADGSGKIDAGELRGVIVAYYDWQKIPADDARVDADVAAILQNVDANKDGKIDKAEFIKYFSG